MVVALYPKPEIKTEVKKTRKPRAKKVKEEAAETEEASKETEEVKAE